MSDRPTYDVDLFSDAALDDPYPHWHELRDLGPVVWLPQHDVYAITRYADVRAVLDDDAIFVSGEGVGLNDLINHGGQGTTLMSDGGVHRTQREIIGRPLTPSALADLRPDAQAIADQAVDELVGRGTFDAVADLAEVLPTQWVPNLLGWPASNRDRLVAWGSAAFDGLGPLNDRANAAWDGILEMSAHAQELAGAELPEGCFAAGILRAAERGEIEPAQCPMLLIDYLGPSLDTTISAIGNAVWLLATHPDQWQLLREDPKRIKGAFNEALRLESPISCFTRVAAVDTVIDGVAVPASARVLASFASANRDERHWDEPERFDVARPNAGQVAFGHGEHACVGMGLARLEGAAILSALAERVEHLELAAEPVRKRNNLIRAFETLPIRVHPRR